MRVIFLDIDGVLNNNDDLRRRMLNNEKWPEGHLTPECILNLNKILDSFDDVSIVLSSSWRDQIPIPDLEKCLVDKGFTHSGKIIGKTVRLPQSYFSTYVSIRQREIEKWVKENSVAKYVILEDAEPMFEYEEFTVRTDETTGLTLEDVDKAIKILSVEGTRD